ncbi:MAG: 4Fe-4S binding protein [Oscillospiraceae bacterium]
MAKIKRKTPNSFRHFFQAFWAIITNSYIIGFVQGKIYRGKIKNVCVPGLNCYSCPGAIGSCPIGSLQAVIGSYEYKWSFYVAGIMICIGSIMGRFVCGWLCPFGFVQDLLNKIPLPQKLKIKTFKGDKPLRKLKYIILLVFVILMPIFAVDLIGQGTPWFCKLICPVGTLEGAIPLVLMNEGLKAAVGWLFKWKMLILIVTIILSIMIYRPFCKYICPLGAIYSLFNPISAFKYKVDDDKCIHCKACEKACPMNCNPTENANDLECIRCGKCKNICPTGAIKYEIFSKPLGEKHNTEL